MPNSSGAVNRPTPDVEDDVRFSEADEPADDRVNEEKSEKQELEEERKRLKGFSQTQLLNVTSMMFLILQRRIVLQEAIDAIMNDNVLTLEATLLEGLDPDTFYKAFVHMPWKSKWDRLALLHWSAYYNASESTEVALSSSPLWITESI